MKIIIYLLLFNFASIGINSTMMIDKQNRSVPTATSQHDSLSMFEVYDWERDNDTTHANNIWIKNYQKLCLFPDSVFEYKTDIVLKKSYDSSYIISELDIFDAKIQDCKRHARGFDFDELVNFDSLKYKESIYIIFDNLIHDNISCDALFFLAVNDTGGYIAYQSTKDSFKESEISQEDAQTISEYISEHQYNSISYNAMTTDVGDSYIYFIKDKKRYFHAYEDFSSIRYYKKLKIDVPEKYDLLIKIQILLERYIDVMRCSG